VKHALKMLEWIVNNDLLMFKQIAQI